MKKLQTVSEQMVDTLPAFCERQYKYEEKMKQMDYRYNDDKEMRKLEEEFTRAVDMK